MKVNSRRLHGLLGDRKQSEVEPSVSISKVQAAPTYPQSMSGGMIQIALNVRWEHILLQKETLHCM